MSSEFRLPDVGEGIHEAEIVRWLVQVGDVVGEFQPFAEVQTDKAVVELSSPFAGRISALRGAPGDVVHVGDVIMEIEPSGGSAAPSTERERGARADESTASSPDEGKAIADKGFGSGHVMNPANGRALAAPAVRKLARRLGLDLSSVRGTGPSGRITRADIERANVGAREATQGTSIASEVDSSPNQAFDGGAARQAALEGSPSGLPVGEPARIPLKGLRRVIADHMVRSAFTAPHVTAFDDCDATRLIEARKNALAFFEASGEPLKLTFMPYFIKAVVAALRLHPQFNAHVDDEAREIVVFPDIHIGIAVDTPDGLMVPVLRDPEKKSIAVIQRELSDLSARARARKCAPQELRGSTFTISNTGAMGGMYATPILNYPEVGILGVHKMEQRAVVRDGQIVIRDMTTMSLSFDHRIIDGALGVKFLNAVRQFVEQPDLLLL